MVNALGKLGIWRHPSQVSDELAQEVEKLGYGTIWLGGSPPAALADVDRLLDATEHIVVATGIVNMWTDEAASVAESYHRIVGRHPGRFLLGVGIGHPEAVQVYQKPYDKIVEYLDQLDEAGVPVEDRALAALGPKVLKLSAERTAGAHPYLTTPEHTRQAREILGEGKLLVPEHKVVLDTDPARARAVGRPRVENPYLHLTNYVSNLKRLGFTDEDIANGGSDRLVDALVLHGDAQQIADGVRAHWDAGADQVTIQVLNEDPLPAYRAVAEVLLS
jgi:probable F420-dependent oxidoreductase